MNQEIVKNFTNTDVQDVGEFYDGYSKKKVLDKIEKYLKDAASKQMEN